MLIFLHKFHNFQKSKNFNHSVKSWKPKQSCQFIKRSACAYIPLHNILKWDNRKCIEPKPKLYVIDKYFSWSNYLVAILIIIWRYECNKDINEK